MTERESGSEKSKMMAVFDFYDRHHSLRKVNRKTYLWFCALGVVGAHHFYAGHWIKGILYILFFWTGIPLAMSFFDWTIALPLTADADGKIEI